MLATTSHNERVIHLPALFFRLLPWDLETRWKMFNYVTEWIRKIFENGFGNCSHTWLLYLKTLWSACCSCCCFYFVMKDPLLFWYGVFWNWNTRPALFNVCWRSKIAQRVPQNDRLRKLNLQMKVYRGSEQVGAVVVRALAFHHCGPRLIPWHSVIYGLSLLVLFSALIDFSPVTPVFSSHLVSAFDLIWYVVISVWFVSSLRSK